MILIVRFRRSLNLIWFGEKAINVGTTLTEKFGLEKDEKHKAWVNECRELIHNARLMYIYGLLCHSFIKATDKSVLRDDIQKSLKVLKKEFFLSEDSLLPSMKDACSSALRFKFLVG